jgi:hypothetical protein
MKARYEMLKQKHKFDEIEYRNKRKLNTSKKEQPKEKNKQRGKRHKNKNTEEGEDSNKDDEFGELVWLLNNIIDFQPNSHKLSLKFCTKIEQELKETHHNQQEKQPIATESSDNNNNGASEDV